MDTLRTPSPALRDRRFSRWRSTTQGSRERRYESRCARSHPTLPLYGRAALSYADELTDENDDAG